MAGDTRPYTEVDRLKLFGQEDLQRHPDLPAQVREQQEAWGLGAALPTENRVAVYGKKSRQRCDIAAEMAFAEQFDILRERAGSSGRQETVARS